MRRFFVGVGVGAAFAVCVCVFVFSQALAREVCLYSLPRLLFR